MGKQLSLNSFVGFLRKRIMYMVLFALIAFFAFTANNFWTPGNFTNILLQATYTIIAGCGVCFIMISGCVDLSIGYQMSLMAAVMGVMINSGANPVLTMLFTLVIGMLLGSLNGILLVKLRVSPMIITLASSYAFQGISFIISKSQAYINFPKIIKVWGQGYLFGVIPVAIIVMIICICIVSFVLGRTYFGRYVYGVGSNEEAIKLAGVNVQALRVIIYTISGVFVALATIVMVGRAGAASSSMGIGTEFTCLSAGILGGISFRGGDGKISGMVLGIIILQVLSNGMQLMGLNVYPQYVVKGVVLAAAVGFDSYQKMKKTKPKAKAA